MPPIGDLAARRDPGQDGDQRGILAAGQGRCVAERLQVPRRTAHAGDDTADCGHVSSPFICRLGIVVTMWYRADVVAARARCGGQMEAASPHVHHADCTVVPRPAGLMAGKDRAPAGGNVTADDLIVAAPWLAFAAGLAVIGWRLAAGRGRRRRRRGPPPSGAAAQPGRDAADDRPAQGRSVAQNAWPRDR
jgi:hypothetical protein